MSTTIKKTLIELRLREEKKLEKLEEVRKRGAELVNVAKKKVWKAHVDNIISDLDSRLVEMYDI